MSGEVKAIRINGEDIEIRAVVHAHWKMALADNGWKDTICSNCGFTINDDIHVTYNYRYCPDCGAKMDEVANNED